MASVEIMVFAVPRLDGPMSTGFFDTATRIITEFHGSIEKAGPTHFLPLEAF